MIFLGKVTRPVCDIYEYLYYRLYNWQLNLWKGKYAPEISALFGPGVLISLNIGVPIIACINCFGSESLRNSDYVVVVTSIIVIFPYLFFILNNRFLLILQKYKKENKEQRKKRTIEVWIYIICSILFAVLFTIIMGELFIV